MYNPQEVIEISQEAMMQPDAAWAKAKAKNRTALQMAQSLTIPLVVVCAAVGFILSLVFSGHGAGVTLLLKLAVLGAALDIILVFLVAFLADYLAKAFGGAGDYNAAFNAVALASVPSALGMAILPVPLIGWIASLALWFYGLYLLYGALPVFLTLPAEKRILHYTCTLLLSVLGSYAVSRVLMG